jgi:hypothetical protein
MFFNPLNFPLVTQSPRLLSDVSAWVEHIPFAFALIQLTRPRLLAELGTHKGDSYCAFCQAIDALGFPTRCFAIDTWFGDQQAGHYSENVLRDLRAHHDPLYARFSTLLQSTFDGAVARFDDGSIDLLHIDGLHTYDAVQHDFLTWRPKLSDAAVVLFHDTAVTTGDFGVHRLWHELRDQYPSFEFLHGSGLGILAVGGHTAPDLLTFLHEARANPAPIRDFFALLGHRLEIARGLDQIILLARRDYDHIAAWRQALCQMPRPPFPTGLSLAELLQSGRPDLKQRVDAIVTAATFNSRDLYAIASDDQSVRIALDHLRPKPQAVAAETSPANAHTGNAHA